MKTFKLLAVMGMWMVALVACTPDPKPSETLFTEQNAWKGDIPSDAQRVSSEEFRHRIDTGELTLVSTAGLEKQKAIRQKQYQDDQSFLQALPNKTPYINALLSQAASSPTFEGDRPVTLPGGQTVLLQGLGLQLRHEVEAYQRSQSADNALADYTLSYSLLPQTLKAQLPSPDSLKGKSLAEIKAALKQLNDLLGANPTSLRSARIEKPGSGWSGVQAQDNIVPGNGRDNDGPCTPTNYVARYWFPLKNFISPVKNQAARGTCWAFAAIGALESRERVQNNNPADLSEQFLVNKVKQDWDASDRDEGYWSENALNTAVVKGQVFPPEASWTYNPSTSRNNKTFANSCLGYSGTCSDSAHQSRQVCTTVTLPVINTSQTFCAYIKVTFGGPGVPASPAIQVWKNGESFDLNRYRLLLREGHVLIANFPVYRGFDEAPNNGSSAGVVSNYDATTLENGQYVAKSRGSHVVQVVDFLSNEELTLPGGPPVSIGGGGYFIIKNSWGCSWGDGGFYYIPADYVSQHFISLSTLSFDDRRSEAWKREQANPGSSEAPKITLKANPATVNLRVETDLAQFFKVSHPVAKSVSLSVTSNLDGTLYNGPWDSDPNVLFGPELKRTLGTPGSRTLTLLAQYGDKQTQASFVVDVVNTPPTLSLQYSGDPHQGEDYPMTALIRDINETDATKLCNNTTWSVDAPDVLSASTSCQVKIKFGSTGNRQVRVSTRDSEGATASQTVTLNVLAPPENPFPRIKSVGVYSREVDPVRNFCTSKAVNSGSTIDLRSFGCSNVGTVPHRYYANAELENPSNETLTYEWKLYVFDNRGEVLLYDSRDSRFELYDYGNEVLVTNDCHITFTVNAPDPRRSKSLTVWTGKCTYHSVRLH